VGVEIDESAVPVQSHPFNGNTAFMLGNEASACRLSCVLPLVYLRTRIHMQGTRICLGNGSRLVQNKPQQDAAGCKIGVVLAVLRSHL
jgi:hypothetical protein